MVTGVDVYAIKVLAREPELGTVNLSFIGMFYNLLFYINISFLRTVRDLILQNPWVVNNRGTMSLRTHRGMFIIIGVGQHHFPMAA